MRLVIKLNCTEYSRYEMQYHYLLQGFIYNLLKGSKYDYIHDKEGYKFFCFSNIFPASDLKKNDPRTMIISSPDNEFITYLHEALQGRDKREIKIGCMKFRLDYIDKLDRNVPHNRPVTLITGTPIIVRIPSKKYREHEITPENEYEYIYWRSDHPIELFISLVESSLLHKYSKYQEAKNAIKTTEIIKLASQRSSIPFFQRFKFKKQISTRIFMKGSEQVVIGTVWEFRFTVNLYNRDIIQFALDCGLGERNSLGFGFMNLLVSQ